MLLKWSKVQKSCVFLSHHITQLSSILYPVITSSPITPFSSFSNISTLAHSPLLSTLPPFFFSPITPRHPALLCSPPRSSLLSYPFILSSSSLFSNHFTLLRSPQFSNISPLPRSPQFSNISTLPRSPQFSNISPLPALLSSPISPHYPALLSSPISLHYPALLSFPISPHYPALLSSPISPHYPLSSVLQYLYITPLSSVFQFLHITPLSSVLQYIPITLLSSVLQYLHITPLSPVLQYLPITLLSSALQYLHITPLSSALQYLHTTPASSVLQYLHITPLSSVLQYLHITQLSSVFRYVYITPLSSVLQSLLITSHSCVLTSLHTTPLSHVPHAIILNYPTLLCSTSSAMWSTIKRCLSSSHNNSWINVVLMLGQRRRRWANIKTALVQRLCLLGIHLVTHRSTYYTILLIWEWSTPFVCFYTLISHTFELLLLQNLYQIIWQFFVTMLKISWELGQCVSWELFYNEHATGRLMRVDQMVLAYKNYNYFQFNRVHKLMVTTPVSRTVSFKRVLPLLDINFYSVLYHHFDLF